MSRHYGRRELLELIALRHGAPEGVGSGDHIFLTGRIQVTPDLIEQMIGGHWVARDGSKTELVGVTIDDDGLIYPEMRRVGAVIRRST